MVVTLPNADWPALRRHESLADLGRSAIDDLDLETVLLRACDLARDGLAVDLGGVITSRDDGAPFDLRAGAGDWDGFDAGRGASNGRLTLAELTVEAGEAIVVDDMKGDERFAPIPFFLARGITSSISVPIGTREESVGVLAGFSVVRRAFTADDIVFLRLVANVIAGAAGASLRASGRYRELFEFAPDMIFLGDANGLLIDANPAAERVSGFTRSELIGKSYTCFLGDPDLESVERFDSTIKTKDGREVPIQTSSRSISRHGEPAGALAIARDMSSHRAFETDLSASEKLGQIVFEHATDVIAVLDAEGVLIRASDSIEEVVGFPPAEAAGRSFVDFMHPDDREAAAGAIAAVVAGGADSRPAVRLRHRDGSLRLFAGSIAAVRGEDGTVGHLVLTGRDITARRLLEAQLQQSQKMEAIGMLAGGVAHDFNNLLTVINGFSDIALRRLDDEQQPIRDPLEQIRRAGERGAALTRQLLAFSRQQVLRPVTLQLNDLVTSYTDMLGRLLGDDIKITTSLETPLPAVTIDPGQLGQVLMNLAANARDAMPNGGELHIATSSPGSSTSFFGALQGLGNRKGYVRLAVTDTGAGMSNETASHVFEPFFTTKPMGDGTGLGLSMVDGLIRQAGGTIIVYSEPGLGATFEIHLPETADESIAGSEHVEPVDATPIQANVLVVEDEPVVRRLLSEMLIVAGCEVSTAATPTEALEQAASCEIDVLVTDVVMPEMNGRELAQAIVAHCPRVLVLYMSGYSADAVLHRGVIETEDSFLQKPFTAEQLQHAVRELVNRRST